MSVDHPPQPMPPPALPPRFNFNHDRYPAYDQHARRIGLEHTRHESRPAPSGGSYYRPRTHHYPGPNVTADDFPHVRALDVRVRPTIPPNEVSTRGRRSRAANNATQSPPEQDASATRDGDVLEREATPDYADEESSPELQSGHPLESEDYNPDMHDPEPALRELLGFGPDEEVSLNSISNPPNGEKPGYPYPTLIKLAIYGSPHKRLTLQEIYQSLTERFDWFRNNIDEKAWQVGASCILHLRHY